jgi:hypothetical protein
MIAYIIEAEDLFVSVPESCFQRKALAMIIRFSTLLVFPRAGDKTK